jgi:PIN domain nuclease of toxin-antitoxin system
MTWVMDACAMIAFLAGEPGADVVAKLLTDSSNVCVAHGVNLCEVYYHTLRASDEKSARAALRDLRRAGIRTRRDMNVSFWMALGQLKANHRVSLGDCFAIELARRLDGPVVTSDHHEFDPLARDRVCRVKFIR